MGRLSWRGDRGQENILMINVLFICKVGSLLTADNVGAAPHTSQTRNINSTLHICQNKIENTISNL